MRELWREMWDLSDQCWTQMSKTLTSLADGADLLLTGQSYQEAVVNVAEYLNVPLATLHHVPVRANGQLVPLLPSPLARVSNDGVRLVRLAPEQESRGRAAP